MMQIIKEWRIIIYFALSGKSITFIIHDNFYLNMLRKLSEIGFDMEPDKIEIIEVKFDKNNSDTRTAK